MPDSNHLAHLLSLPRLLGAYRSRSWYRLGLLLFCWLGLLNASWAQQDSLEPQQEPVIRGYGFQLLRGFVLGQGKEVAHLAYEPTFGAQLDIMPRHLISRPWLNAYRGANFGYTLLVNSNGPNRILGTSVAAAIFMETHVLRRQRHKILFRAGFGPTWSSSPWDLNRNPLNVAIGSPITALLQGSLTYSTGITPQLWLRSGLVLTHYSNGSYTMPNYGLNMPALSVGLNYYVQPPTDYRRIGQRNLTVTPLTDSLPAWRHELKGYVVGQLGVAETFPTSGPKYSTIMLGGFLSYRVGLKSALTGGVEYMYNNTMKPFSETVPEYRGKDITRWAVTLGHDLHINKVNVHTQLGIYIYKPLAYQGAVYQRLTSTYEIMDRVRAGISLKLHGFSAETLEGTVGVRVF